jgi:hypothetical protein
MGTPSEGGQNSAGDFKVAPTKLYIGGVADSTKYAGIKPPLRNSNLILTNNNIYTTIEQVPKRGVLLSVFRCKDAHPANYNYYLCLLYNN